ARLIAKILKLQRDRELFGSHGCNHRLQIIPALAVDADLFALDLGRYLQFALANETGDLLGDGLLDALIDFYYLAGMAERRNVWLAALDVLEADLAFGQFAHDDFDQRLKFKLIFGGKLDLILLKHN